MPKVVFKAKGDWRKFNSYCERIKEKVKMGDLDYYGKLGVEILAYSTPEDTGKTASCWNYEIERSGDTASLYFTNDNTNNGVNIAVILDVGHGTGRGAYVSGRNYISPAAQSIFDDMVDEMWEEVSRQ